MGLVPMLPGPGVTTVTSAANARRAVSKTGVHVHRLEVTTERLFESDRRRQSARLP